MAPWARSRLRPCQRTSSGTRALLVTIELPHTKNRHGGKRGAHYNALELRLLLQMADFSKPEKPKPNVLSEYLRATCIFMTLCMQACHSALPRTSSLTVGKATTAPPDDWPSYRVCK